MTQNTIHHSQQDGHKGQSRNETMQLHTGHHGHSSDSRYQGDLNRDNNSNFRDRRNHRDYREPRDYKAHRDYREHGDYRENRDYRDNNDLSDSGDQGHKGDHRSHIHHTDHHTYHGGHHPYHTTQKKNTGRLWLLNGNLSLTNLNFNQLVYSNILSSSTFKDLKKYETMSEFGKYLKKCITFRQQDHPRGTATSISTSDGSSVSGTSNISSITPSNLNTVNTKHSNPSGDEVGYPYLKCLDMRKNLHAPQMLPFEWLMKLHMLFRSMQKSALGATSSDEDSSSEVATLDSYVQNIHFKKYLQSKSNIIWIEIALYCLWIRFMIDPYYQLDMYRALFYSQQKKMETIPIFCKFDTSSSIEKITMPQFVSKLISNHKVLGTILPRLPKRAQDDMKWRWGNEMKNLGITLKLKQKEGVVKEQKTKEKEEKEAVKEEKIEITDEGRARFSQKPKPMKGFLDLSRYVSSHNPTSHSESSLNYHSRDTITIGRPNKKRRIGL